MASPAPDDPPNATSFPDTSTSLTSFLPDLHFKQASTCIRRLFPRHELVRFHLTPLHCVVETVDEKKERLKLPWQDVLGAHVVTLDGTHVTQVDTTGTNSPPSSSLQLGLFACVSYSATSSGLKTRKTRDFYFTFQHTTLPQVLQLQALINYVADPRNQEEVEQVETFDQLQLVARPRRKFLVLVNPVSGKGKSVRIYEKKAAPVFRFANIETQVLTMTHANHAMELAMELSLNEFDCVVAIGGDGSLYEIVQGLMKRRDWNVAIRQPIGIIPGGSGNGLASSIASQCQERPKPVNLAYILAKGTSHGLDIASMRNGKDTVYSFLSMAWASIADVDLDSEKLRCLGSLRFTITFLNQLIFQRPKYPGTIWYLDEDETLNPPNPYVNDDYQDSKDGPIMDEFDGERGPPDVVGTKGDASSGKWKKLGPDFRIVWIMNISHAGEDARVAPQAPFDDGFHYITYIDGSYARTDLAAMLLAMDTGRHVDLKCVQQIRTRAYKVVPERPTDRMCVDGELIEGPYVEAQVHRALARILLLPK